MNSLPKLQPKVPGNLVSSIDDGHLNSEDESFASLYARVRHNLDTLVVDQDNKDQDNKINPDDTETAEQSTDFLSRLNNDTVDKIFAERKKLATYDEENKNADGDFKTLYSKVKRSLDALVSDDEDEKIEQNATKALEAYDNMYMSPDMDYEAEYDKTMQENLKGDKVTNVGILSHKWQEMGGAVKYDKHGNAVLDIETQNELAKNDANVSDAKTLLSAITKHGYVQRDDADYLYNASAKYFKDKPNFEKGENNDYKVINTSLLTPDERKELKKYQKDLMDAGIIGQDIAKYRLHKRQLNETSPRSMGEKATRWLKYAGRGIAGVADMARLALVAEYRDANPDADIDPEKKQVLNTYEQSNLVQGYDRWQDISEPETTAEKVMELFGATALPTGGLGVAGKAKSLIGTLTGAVGATKAKEIIDWMKLTDEERAKEVKVNAPLRNMLIDIVGLTAGHSLVNIPSLFKKTPNVKGLTAQEKEKIKIMMSDKNAEKYISESAKQTQRAEIEEAYNKLREQLNNPTPFRFTEAGTINSISAEELQRNKPIIDHIMLQEHKRDLQDALSINTTLERSKLPFEVNDTESASALEKIQSRYSEALGGTYKGQRSELAVPENIAHFDEQVKLEKEIASRNYESKVKDIANQPIYDKNKMDNLFQERELEKSNVTLTDDQQKLVSYFRDKFDNAETMADVRNIMSDIRDRYKSADNKERYILNEFRKVNAQLIDDEIKAGGERGKWFENLKQANEEYGKHVEKIDMMDDISEIYKGNKSRYQAPENREVKLGTSLADNWDKLTNEQKSMVIEKAPGEVRKRLQQLELLTINPKKITEYDNLILRNAFGENAEEVINLTGQIVARRGKVSQVDALLQAITEYNNHKLSSDELHNIFSMASGDSNKLGMVFNNVVKQNEIFTTHKFAEYARKGDVISTADLIRNTDDLRAFNNLMENWQSRYNMPQVKDFTKQVKDYKWGSIIKENSEIYNELTSYLDTPEKITASTFLKQAEKSIMHFNKHKRILEELANNNKNILANFEAIQHFSEFATEVISNAEDYVEIVLKNDQPLQKYRALVAKKEAKLAKLGRPSKVIQTIANKTIDYALYSSAFGNFAQFVKIASNPITYVAWPVYLLGKGLKSMYKSLVARSLNKLRTDPEYIYKKIYETKSVINRLEEYIYEIKNISAKFFPKTVAGTTALEIQSASPQMFLYDHELQ